MRSHIRYWLGHKGGAANLVMPSTAAANAATPSAPSKGMTPVLLPLGATRRLVLGATRRLVHRKRLGNARLASLPLLLCSSPLDRVQALLHAGELPPQGLFHLLPAVLLGDEVLLLLAPLLPLRPELFEILREQVLEMPRLLAEPLAVVAHADQVLFKPLWVFLLHCSLLHSGHLFEGHLLLHPQPLALCLECCYLDAVSLLVVPPVLLLLIQLPLQLSNMGHEGVDG